MRQTVKEGCIMRKGLFIVMGLMGLSVLLSSCSGYGSRKDRIPKIESFEILTLSETGMRGNTEEWEIQKTEEGAVYTRYSGTWRFNDDVEREDCIVSKDGHVLFLPTPEAFRYSV